MAPCREHALLRELASLAEAIAHRARPLCSGVEVRVVRRDLLAFEVEERTLAPRLEPGQLQVQLRAVKEGRLVQAETESFSVEENVAVLRRALSGGRATPLLRFGAGRPPVGDASFDPQLAALAEEPARLQSLAVALRDGAAAALARAPHAGSVRASLRVLTRHVALATNDGALSAVENWFVAEARTAEGAVVRRVLRRLPEDLAQVSGLGARVVEESCATPLHPEDVGVGRGAPVAVLLAPMVLERLLREVAEPAFCASRLAAGQIVLPHGELLVDPRLRLVDTALAGDQALRAIDDELQAKEDVVLLAGGRLEGWVSSQQSALAAQVAPTGNGLRHAPLDEGPDGQVSDRLWGLAMDAGGRTLAELRAGGLVLEVRDVGELRVDDRARTGFSATITDGRLHRDGALLGRTSHDAWRLAGRVLPAGGDALTSEAEPSQERDFTGSALLPWLRTQLHLAP